MRGEEYSSLARFSVLFDYVYCEPFNRLVYEKSKTSANICHYMVGTDSPRVASLHLAENPFFAFFVSYICSPCG
jgi:hypothetical protein